MKRFKLEIMVIVLTLVGTLAYGASFVINTATSTSTPATPTWDPTTTYTSTGNPQTNVNIVSDTGGIMAEATKPSDSVGTQTITLVANTTQKITSKLGSTVAREFIMLHAMAEDKDFWVQVNGSATVNASLLVHEWLILPVTEDVDVYIIASEAFDIYVLEGGK